VLLAKLGRIAPRERGGMSFSYLKIESEISIQCRALSATPIAVITRESG
jgi:hypothetical protein